jgi:PhnB protein
VSGKIRRNGMELHSDDPSGRAKQPSGAAMNFGGESRHNHVDLTPYLLFDGNCAEAMTFYQFCLGGELTITRVADTTMRDEAPPGDRQKVAFARLQSGGVQVSATDWRHPTRAFEPGNTVGMYLTSNDATELRTVFDRLSAGADAGLLDPLTDLPFGLYGHLRDAYGVHWFFRGERNA